MFPSLYVRTAIHDHGSSPATDRISNPLVRRACVLLKSSEWCLSHLRFFIFREKYFPRFELLLSKACPFNCKCCIHFLPDYEKNAACEPADAVIADMEKLLAAVERIDVISISGGDAFLYPELSRVVQYLDASEKIGRIIIVSTGAVAPDQEVLKLLSSEKIQIKVDNYGKYSDKMDKFISLALPGVFITEYYDKWDDFGDAGCRGRSLEELKRQYAACKKERYCMMNGKIYACPRSAHGEDLGFFTNEEAEYVNLREASGSREILKGIRQLRKIDHLTACDHCNSCSDSFKVFGIEERFKE